ncbi:MAG: hypothetical protein CL609_19555 [Anaerolineaceae bacterium]|nr:hypothetical protein [Anaerolineaceae bacterium]
MNKLRQIIKNKNTFALFIVLITPLIFFIEAIFYKKVLYWGTTSTQFFPWMEYAIQQILQGNLPLWNPYNGWGAPLLANYQSALFYPPNWGLIIFYLIDPPRGLFFGYTILLVFHLQLGGVGFYRLLTKLELNTSAKILGSIVFILSGYLINRINFISMIWAMVWMPWIIIGVYDLFRKDKKSIKYIRLDLIIPISMQLLAGHAQTTYYTLLVSCIFFLAMWFSHSHKFKLMITYALNILISIGVCAIQLIPTAEYLLQSQRSDEVGFAYATNYSFWPWRILSIVFPDFWGNPMFGRYLGGGNFWEDHIYLGVFSFIFIIFAIIIILRNKEKMSSVQILFYRVCFVLIPFSFLMALGKNFILFPFFYHYIPTFDLFQAPSRFILIYTFCGSILAAAGFAFWQKKQIPARKTGIFIFIFIAIIIGVFVSRTYLIDLPVSIVNSLYLGSMLSVLFGGLSIIKNRWFKKHKNLINIFILLVVFLDLYWFANQNNQFAHYHFYDPIHQKNERWTSEIVYLEKRSEEFIKFNQNFRFDRFQDFNSRSSEDLMFLPDTNLFSPQYQMINNFDPFVPGNYSMFMTNLSTLSIYDQKSVLKNMGVTKFVSLDSPWVDFPNIANIKSDDIVQWYNCSLVRPADEILKELLYNKNINNVNRCLFLTEKEDLQNKNPKNASLSDATVHYQHKSANTFEISYTSDNDGWLVIRNNYYPGWKAILDDRETIELQEADYLFTGLNVPAGNHKIILFYQPFSYRLGFMISLVSFLMLFILRNTF